MLRHDRYRAIHMPERVAGEMSILKANMTDAIRYTTSMYQRDQSTIENFHSNDENFARRGALAWAWAGARSTNLP